jgi:DNA (cytosine-5)-methyltransferase 1
MDLKINLLDVFAGIGGFSLGLERAGFVIKRHYFSEIDRHAKAIFKKRFKGAISLGDVRHVRSKLTESINVFTFGSPCQDFSLVGKREGLSGERSSLISETFDIIDEFRPDVFIWENVKGVFSSGDGEDFISIIKALSLIGGYNIGWQLLNTSWIYPQNRERVYLVGISSKYRFLEIFPLSKNDLIIQKPDKQLFREIRSDKSVANCLVRSMSKMARTDNYLDYGFSENGDHRIRRLTELECERLQGFPDEWTKYGDYSGEIKRVPMTKRYQCLGNAVSVPIVEIIGKKIKSLYCLPENEVAHE